MLPYAPRCIGPTIIYVTNSLTMTRIYVLLIALLAAYSAEGQFALRASNDVQALENTRLAEGGIDEWTEIFDELPTFEKGATVWQLGLGLLTNTKIEQYDTRIFVPPVTLFVEKSAFSNVGLGIFVGYHSRSVPEYLLKYNYFCAGGRVAYHFNVHEKLDPYIGLGGTLRYFEVRSGWKSRPKGRLSPIGVIGARYYLSNRFGVFGEIGGDGMTHFKVGLQLRSK